jgi:putative transposase
MDNRQRHTPGQIEKKLKEAEDLAAHGRTQREIAQVLGISVMTFHRWRKGQSLQAASGARSTPADVLTPERLETQRAARYAELQTENIRLRRLVTDLLLEKMKLEEDVRDTLESEDVTPIRKERKVG